LIIFTVSEFDVYQFIVQLLEPFTFLTFCLAAALIWAWRRQKPRSRPLKVMAVLLSCLILASTPVAGYLSMWTLEAGYPPHDEIPNPEDTLVVLSAGLILENEETGQVHLDYASGQRCRNAIRLYKKAGRCRMILSGGKVNWDRPGPTLAEAMRQFAEEMGVRPEDIQLEDKSSNTFQNAVYSKKLLEKFPNGRVWLVTSASHMHRSVRCFQKQGISVLPAPCCHEAGPWQVEASDFLPSSGGMQQFTRAVHEWQGRVWYSLRGKI
jgi:uncharacterized SAM-binding protein YcdF (DUF218 family)